MLYQVSRISWIRITSFHPHSHQSPTLQRRAQLGAEGTWDEPERKPNGLLLRCLLYQLEAFIPLQPAWIIQWLYPFSLGCGPQLQKEPYCCWFVSMRRLSAAKENIKKQLIRRRAKERRSRRGLRRDRRYLRRDLETLQKTWKRWLLVWLLLISADGWVTGGRTTQTKAIYDQHNQCDISTADNARGLVRSGPSQHQKLFLIKLQPLLSQLCSLDLCL